MRIRLSIPDHLVTPRALEAALEATALANAEAIRRGEIPHAVEAIERGAKWRPEPFMDGEHFDLGHQVVQRGWGDCDDLAPYLAGSLIASGEDEGARTVIQKTGRHRYHAVVQTSDGRILDPSRWAGMGKRSAPSVAGVAGSAVSKPFAHPNGGALCVVPHAGNWWARCDLPWPEHAGQGHIASHARSRDIHDALDRAVTGAIACGEQIESPLLERASCAGQFLLSDSATVGESVLDHALKLRKQWDDEMVAKGYTKENPPPASGPDSWVEWGQAHGLHKGSGTSFGAALRGVARVIRGTEQAAAPVANLFAPGAGTMLQTLSQGAGVVLPPPEGGQVITARNGAVSVPLESPSSPASQHMFLYYHPRGNPGPVIMRF